MRAGDVSPRRAPPRGGSYLVWLLPSAALLALAPNAQAQTTTWEGDVSNDWFNAGNWDNGLPTGVDDAQIVSGNPTIAAPTAEASSIFLNGASLTVSGPIAALDANAIVYVGNTDAAALTIEDGAFVAAGGLYVSFSAGGDGDVLVTGANSTLHVGLTRIGFGDFGSLRIEDGAQLSSLMVFIGDTDGDVSVSGAGSFLDNTFGVLYVGSSGFGTLSVDDGGAVNAGTAYFASDFSGFGGMLIGDAHSTFNADFIFAGVDGEAAFSIFDGGAVTAADGAYLGVNSDGLFQGVVSGAGAAFNVTNGDIVIGSDGAAQLNVGNGGSVSANTIVIASNSGSFGTLVIGGPSPFAQAPAGSVNGAIQFGDGIGFLVFNHTETDYSFSNAISGPGEILAFSGVTNLTGGNSGFTGIGVVDNGAMLRINGAFGGDVAVFDGILGGGGSILGDLDVFDRLAPGNSIGTLTAATAAFEAGSTFEVEVNASGASDRLNVTGDVDIEGGAVRVFAAPGAFALQTNYTILQAASISGVGAFDSVSLASGPVFLTPSLSYDATHVYLRLTRNALGFADIGLTPNQRNAGGGVGVLGAGNPLHDAALVLNAAGARAAFDDASGDMHASLRGLSFHDASWLGALIETRLAQVSEAPSLVQLAAIDGAAAAGSRSRGFWAQAFGGWGEAKSDGNAAGFDYDRSGAAFGADAPLGATGRIGAAFSYASENADQDAHAGEAGIAARDLSVYGGFHAGAVSLRGALGFGWRNVKTARRVAIVNETLRADYDSSTAYGQIEIGARLGRFEPFLALSHIALESNGFSESGGAAALIVADSRDAVTFASLGVRISGPSPGGGRVFGSAAWRHAEGDITPVATTAFASNPGERFVIAGAPIAQDALALQLAAEIGLGHGAALTASYRGDIAEDARAHGVDVRVAWRF